MDFNKNLTSYMELLKCSTNDICDISGITYSMVNRYINGKRTPKEDGKNFNKLVDALYQISKQKDIDLSKDSIYNTLKKALAGNAFQIDFDLNDYIGTDFSKVKVPTSPVIIRNSKTFLGNEGRKHFVF